MKLYKRVLFLATFGSVFIFVYKNCEKKGIRRWLISFRLAVFITLTGILGIDSTDRSDPIIMNIMNNDRTLIEKVISNQEFDSLDKSDRQVILVKAEGNPVIQSLLQPEAQSQVIFQLHPLLVVDLVVLYQG